MAQHKLVNPFTEKQSNNNYYLRNVHNIEHSMSVLASCTLPMEFLGIGFPKAAESYTRKKIFQIWSRSNFRPNRNTTGLYKIIQSPRTQYSLPGCKTDISIHITQHKQSVKSRCATSIWHYFSLSPLLG